MFHLLAAGILFAVCSCSSTQPTTDSDINVEGLDFSLFYHADSSTYTDDYIYDAHRAVQLGKPVRLATLDSLFGKPMLCDTVLQTLEWALHEQECQAADFMPSEIGDTLVMLRRIYGKDGDWLIWIDLEVRQSDSLRVINIIAYDNSRIDI